MTKMRANAQAVLTTKIICVVFVVNYDRSNFQPIRILLQICIAEKFLCKIFLGPGPEVEIKSSQKISQKAATEVFN